MTLSTSILFIVVFSFMSLSFLIYGLTSGDYICLIAPIWFFPFVIVSYNELVKNLKKTKDKKAVQKNGINQYGYITEIESQNVSINGFVQKNALVLLSYPLHENRIVTCDIGSNHEDYQKGDYVVVETNQIHGLIKHKIFRSEVPEKDLQHFDNYASYNESTLASMPSYAPKVKYSSPKPKKEEKAPIIAFMLAVGLMTGFLIFAGIAVIAAGLHIERIEAVFCGAFLLLAAIPFGKLTGFFAKGLNKKE